MTGGLPTDPRPIRFCSLYQRYTRSDGCAYLSHDHPLVSDFLSLSDLDWVELDGDLYEERWNSGDRPPSLPGRW